MAFHTWNMRELPSVKPLHTVDFSHTKGHRSSTTSTSLPRRGHHLSLSSPVDKKHPEEVLSNVSLCNDPDCDGIRCCPMCCHAQQMNVVDDSLFRHALAALQQDHQLLALRENTHGKLSGKSIKMSSTTAVSVAKLAAIKGSSRDMSAPPTRVSLAATHPNNYHRSSPTKNTHKSLRTHMHVTKRSATASPHHDVKPPSQAVALYPDASGLISQEPRFDDPKQRMLKIDVHGDQPRVVSPCFMIGLPLGGMIEMANYYPDERK